MGNYYATPENDTGEADLHIRGTIPRGTRGGLEFWLSRPRPKGFSVDEWDKLEQEKWDRIFGGEMKSDYDRYFKKTDGKQYMAHIGCIDNAARVKREEVFARAIGRDGGEDLSNILMESAMRAGYPSTPCSFCGIEGRLKKEA